MGLLLKLLIYTPGAIKCMGLIMCMISISRRMLLLGGLKVVLIMCSSTSVLIRPVKRRVVKSHALTPYPPITH